MKLVVTQAFADKNVGDEISDAKEIEAVLAERPGAVVKVASEAAEPVEPLPVIEPARLGKKS